MYPGTSFTVSGTGFAPGEQVQLTESQGSCGSPVPATADSSGSFSEVTVTESCGSGNYTVSAQGQSSRAQATASLTVACQLSLQITQTGETWAGPPGGIGWTVYSYRLDATGFPDGDTVTFSWDAPGSRTELETVTADNSGNASITTPLTAERFNAWAESGQGCGTATASNWGVTPVAKLAARTQP